MRLARHSQLLVLTLTVGWTACASSPTEANDKAWPFYQPRAVEPPKVGQAARVRNPIDAFILRKLEQRMLKPAPEADRRTLIRRLTLDLIGLPPTPTEVEAFVADKDPKAYEKLVDRLLKDPRYGERWARFWLDLARYADTAGYEGDPDLPHVWRYRDYVIDAFNNDKPYDLFIKEQIAGDEFAEILGAGDLPATPAERVVALTFLRLAPFTEPRGDESRHELISEMTATVGSVFLGLTVGCAKCHDHKHDNIPTKDFYRMKAFFSTVAIPRPEPGDGFQIGGPIAAEFYRPDEKKWAERRRLKYQQEIVDSKKELADLTAVLEKKLEGRAGFGMQAMGGSLGNDYFFDRRPVSDGKLHVVIVNSDSKTWQFFTDGTGPGKLGTLSGDNHGHWFGDIPRLEYVSLGKHTEGTGHAHNLPHAGHFAEILIYDHPLNDTERTVVANYVKSKYETGGATLAPPQAGLRFWLDAADVDADAKTANPKPGTPIAAWTDKVGGVQLVQDKPPLQPVVDSLGKAKTAAVKFTDDSLVGTVASAKFLKDQQGALVVVLSATHQEEGYGFEVGGDGEFVSSVIFPRADTRDLAAAIADSNSDVFTEQERDRYAYLSTRERFLNQHLKRLRPVAMSLRHSYGPPYEPGVPMSRVMIRGEYNNPGEVVKAGFLSSISGNQQPAKIRLDPFKRWPMRSRRMALAQWIASSDNPLTARVMANRLWHWHFGRGIVPTPSDFGQLSGGPTHPELLDWLALQFVKEKWSVKAMHRLMVTSSTYRRSSRYADARSNNVDPENKLLWRFRRRRLEAEAIRDSVLAVSGRLNPERNGLPIFPLLPGDIAQRVKYDASKWDTQTGPEGRKRSIYIYQQRTLTMPLLQVFDALVCDESRPRRRTSVTPLQALAMYNGDFVNEEARHFAERVRKLAGEDQTRQIEHAFQLALCRPPSGDVTARMTKFFQASESADAALVGLCRILYNSNEFMYID